MNGDPRILSLANGLADLSGRGGGGGTPGEVPAMAPPQAPATPSRSLLDMYIEERAKGLKDTDAALSVARRLRGEADVRSSFREAGAIASGRPFDPVSDRAQLMSEANAPIADLEQRRKVPGLAGEEMQRQTGLMGQELALQQQRGLLNPQHPANVLARNLLAKSGVQVPPGLTIPTLPPDIQKQFTSLIETEQKAPLTAAQAGEARGRGAEARATAAKTTALTGPEAQKTAAEAEKAAAEAAVERQKVGGQVAPGWTRSGTVANVGDKEIQDFRTQATGANESERITKELIGILGDKDYPNSFKKIARAAVLSGKLLAAGKTAMGIRGLPANDVQYLQSMQGDLSAGNWKNWLGLHENVTRLKELNKNVQAELEAQGKTLGLSRAGGTATAGNDDAQALEWAKANPNDPRAKKILTLASPKVATGP